MISRRLLRIKTIQLVYAYYKNQDKSINQAEKELFYSIQKSYDLYQYLFLLAIELVQYAQERIEIAKNKRMPTYGDLHPNTKFVDNQITKRLFNSEKFNIEVKNKMSWVNYPELIKKFYKELTNSTQYKEYMASDSDTLQEDVDIWKFFYGQVLPKNDLIEQILEEQSIYWNDDLDFVLTMILKTLKRINKKRNDIPFFPLYKNEEDREFVKILFRKAILNQKEYLEIIQNHTRNWDIERIAFMDIIILELAIAELIEFNSIPVKVTLNEFIEISKYYSTEKSCNFINGILDKIVTTLKKEKKINKQGRGLIGEE